jgi:hypothetical protein
MKLTIASHRRRAKPRSKLFMDDRGIAPEQPNEDAS